MNVNFYLDRNKTTRDVKTIWCYVRSKENQIYLNTKERVNYKYWDKEKQRVNLRKVLNPSQKASHKALNEYLDAFESKVHSIIRTLRLNDPLISDQKIIDEIHKKSKRPNPSFFHSFEEFLAIQRINLKKDSMKKYDRAKSILKEFETDTGYKLTFDKINRRFYDKIIPYLVEYKGKGMNNNTIGRFITCVKTFMNWAVDCDLTENTSFRSFKVKYEENDIIYLDDSEIEKIYSLDLSDNKKLDRVRDVFLFQCYTGVRYSDIENIKQEDIKSNTWYFKTQKTKDDLSVPLLPKAVSILHKYSEFPQPLPVISNQKMNEYIKDVCMKAKINTIVKIIRYKGINRIEKSIPKYKSITTHTARRTFISISVQNGMSAEIVMSITGHKTYNMMRKYLKVVDRIKKSEMEKAWGHNLRKIS